jgi:hypothetical protein
MFMTHQSKENLQYTNQYPSAKLYSLQACAKLRETDTGSGDKAFNPGLRHNF